MLHANDKVSGEAFSGEDALAVGHSFARSLVCIDPDCTEALVWKPGHGGRCPHWAHLPGAPSCGGAVMTVKHQLMQAAMQSLGLWIWSRKEQYVHVPEHPKGPRRTLAGRRIDVAAKFDSAGTIAKVSIECQHSGTNLRREELRVQDHNLCGLPVLMVVSSDCIRDAGGGRARVDFWVREWAKRHGRQQVAVVDDDGTLWWCWFENKCTDTLIPTTRVRIRPGATSADGRWKMGLTVDMSDPEPATGAPSLLIAAFSWLTTGGGTKRRPARLYDWDPERQPIASYLGSAEGKSLFHRDEIVVGGF